MATMPVPKGFYVTSHFGPRGGTIHYGTDFGNGGGSGGHPIYAVKDMTVTMVGAASGFGQWIVGDHHAIVGGGTSVYGHIIPEVSAGQFIREGQRIGRINPDSRTNGGVAPHLHYEYHRYGYAPPGANRLDPMKTVLVGARWVGHAKAPATQEKDTPRTIYGVDVSNHQNGISCKRIASEGFRFCIIKATEGTWKDPIFRSHLADAKSTSMHVAAYVYVRGETSPAAHAKALHEQVRDTTIPVALDIEHNSGTSVSHWKAIRDAIESYGYRVILTYIPEWYWIQVGRPNLAGLPPLWSSRYPSTASNYASVLFSTAGTRGWQAYGGVGVKVWQFTDRAQVAGYKIDANAFQGTEAQLKTLFTGKDSEEELTMSQMQEIIKKIEAEGEKTRAFIKAWFTGFAGPIGADVKDIRQQVTGSRDSIPGDLAASYQGWNVDALVNAAEDKMRAGQGLTAMEMLALMAYQVLNESDFKDGK